jgi:hypothetical protein
VLGKYLSVSRGWSLVFAGAAFGLAIFLSAATADSEVPAHVFTGNVSRQKHSNATRVEDRAAAASGSRCTAMATTASGADPEVLWKTLIVAASITLSLAALMHYVVIVMLKRYLFLFPTRFPTILSRSPPC